MGAVRVARSVDEPAEHVDQPAAESLAATAATAAIVQRFPFAGTVQPM